MSIMTENAVLLSLLRAKEQHEKNRRESANIRMQIYNDDWLDVLDQWIRKIFVAENYQSLRLLMNISLNPYKFIVNSLGNVYNKGAIRSYGLNGSHNEKMQEVLGEDFNMDEYMQVYNRYTFGLNDNMIQVRYNPMTELIELPIITPAVSSVIQDPTNPQKAKAIYYTLKFIDTEKNVDDLWIYWDDEHNYKINKEKGLFIPIEGNEDMENPYEVMPFVITHTAQIPGSFWNPALGNDMINGTIKLGMNNTMKDQLFKDASFKEIYVIGGKTDQIPADQLRAPEVTKTISDTDARVEMLDLTADFDSLNGDINTALDHLLNQYNLNLDSFKGVESGLALEVRNRGLKEARREQIPTYRQTEKDLAHMIATVYNVHHPNSFPEDMEFSIDYPEMETFQDPDKMLEFNKKRREEGIISPGGFYMIYDPDTKNEKEAEKKIEENRAKLAKFKDAGNGFSEPLEDDDLDTTEL